MRQMLGDKASNASFVYLSQADSLLRDPSRKVPNTRQETAHGLYCVALMLQVRRKLWNIGSKNAVFQPRSRLNGNNDFVFHDALLGRQKRPHQKTTEIMCSTNKTMRENNRLFVCAISLRYVALRIINSST